MQTTDNQSYTFTLLGACGVGKSSILHRFISDRFSTGYSPTIWDTYQLVKTFDGQDVELELIDTAGLESPDSPATKRKSRAVSLPNRYGFILVYDICNTDSYRVSVEMLQQIKSDPEKAKVACLMVGNQTDRETERTVNQREVELMADKFNIKLIESSAKENENIELIFHTMVQEIELAQLLKDSQESLPCSTNSSLAKMFGSSVCTLF